MMENSNTLNTSAQITKDFNCFTKLDESIMVVVNDKNAGEMPPKSSVIVVTYNNKESLSESLEALKNQTFKNFEILVIDNNDTLNIIECVVKYNVHYIKLKKNYGLTVGRNVGIKHSKADIVIFLDDDAIPANNFVEEHVAAHENYNIFGLRGKSLPKTKSIYNQLTSHYDLGEQVIQHYINLEGNSSFKRSFLIEMGGFSPELQYAGGYEGLELTYRAIAKYKDKNKFIYNPKAIIYHDFSSTFAKYIKKHIRHAKHKRILESKFPNIFLFSQEYTFHPKIKNTSLNFFEQLQLNLIKLTTKIIGIRCFFDILYESTNRDF